MAVFEDLPQFYVKTSNAIYLGKTLSWFGVISPFLNLMGVMMSLANWPTMYHYNIAFREYERQQKKSARGIVAMNTSASTKKKKNWAHFLKNVGTIIMIVGCWLFVIWGVTALCEFYTRDYALEDFPVWGRAPEEGGNFKTVRNDICDAAEDKLSCLDA